MSSASCSTTSGLPTPCASPVPGFEESDDRLAKVTLNGNQESENLIKREKPGPPKLDAYPDASCWSIEEVVEFFESIGFIEQADAFREQEIDGQSLLLMKRSDVLTGLSIRLGPALKLYQHVIKLQTAPHRHSIFVD